jgi:hypothetical protein
LAGSTPQHTTRLLDLPQRLSTLSSLAGVGVVVLMQVVAVAVAVGLAEF